MMLTRLSSNSEMGLTTSQVLGFQVTYQWRFFFNYTYLFVYAVTLYIIA